MIELRLGVSGGISCFLRGFLELGYGWVIKDGVVWDLSRRFRVEI